VIRIGVAEPATIVVPVKAITRIFPQMPQISTDEESHLCSSVNICGHLWMKFPRLSHGESWPDR
jgi:hypothetical protein